MKTLLKKWNCLFALFMMCSVPLFVACGDDDKDPTDDNPGNVSGEYIGWKDSGNTATFGYKASAGGYGATAIYTLTFNGSGTNATCTKCVLEETWSHDVAAQASETAWKELGNSDGVISVKRNGKKVTIENKDFVGDTRGDIKKSLELVHPK